MAKKTSWSVRQGTDKEAQGFSQMSYGSQVLRISTEKKVILITHGYKGQSPYPSKEEKKQIISAVEQQLQ
jgi:hypothetical protein